MKLTESILAELVGVKDINLSMNLFGGMGTKLNFAVLNVLNQLEHAILDLLGVIRLLDVLSYQIEIIVFHFACRIIKQLAFVNTLGDIFVDIDTDEDTHLAEVVEEWSQSEIARSTEEAHHGIKILYAVVVPQNAFKLFNKSVATSVGENVGIGSVVIGVGG